MKEPNYEFLGDDLYHVYIPEHYPLRMKLMVLAALKTYRMGNKSIDYMLKRYGDDWAEQFDITCRSCGRVIRFRKEFDPNEGDFIIQCDRCGQFFCRNCLDWEHPVSDADSDVIEIHCHNCSDKSKRRKAKLKREVHDKKKEVGQVIRLEDRRKKR